MKLLSSKTAGFLALVAAFSSAVPSMSFGNVSLVDNAQWKVNLSGFIELDSITDSTRSFNEVVGNAPVLRTDGANGTLSSSGAAGRDQLSIRNTRFALTMIAPELDGWSNKGYLEYDLLGYDPSPGTAGNSEAGLFNNPTLRLRHGFIEIEKNQWQFIGGQTWAILGWQPIYFTPSVQVAPVSGELYSRTTQIRGTKTLDFGDKTYAQIAVGMMRPPQRDAGLPALESGLRLAYDGWSGGYVASATPVEKVQPLSIAISGTIREFSTPTNSDAYSTTPTGSTVEHTGHGIAIDALIPVIPSSDGKDFGNTLTIGGEYSQGTGDGDEFSNWTGGLPNPLNSSANVPNKNLDLDGGIGGYDANQNFDLVDVSTLNVYAQYHLPSHFRTWFSAGYAQLYSDNIGALTQSLGTTVAYDREQVGFVNVFKDFSDQIRLALEVAQYRTSYVDGDVTHDNRLQVSAWFFF
jgi:hypothetical protein